METKKVLVIIPAYNEEESIEKVIKDIKNNTANLEYVVDYLVVNDCSKDDTLSILQQNARNYISLPINLGIGGGVQSGYLYAYENDYDVAVQMDGDGQHDPKYLDAVVSPVLKQEADVAIGSRFINKEGFQSSSLRRAGIKFLSGLIKFVCGAKVKDVTSGFRAANAAAVKAFTIDYAQDYPEPEAIVMCAKKGFKIKEVPVIMRERQGGESSISSFKSVYYMIKVSIAIIFAGVLHK